MLMSTDNLHSTSPQDMLLQKLKGNFRIKKLER